VTWDVRKAHAKRYKLISSHDCAIISRTFHSERSDRGSRKRPQLQTRELRTMQQFAMQHDTCHLENFQKLIIFIFKIMNTLVPLRLHRRPLICRSTLSSETLEVQCVFIITEIIRLCSKNCSKPHRTKLDVIELHWSQRLITSDQIGLDRF
jgi:hypothetical protein